MFPTPNDVFLALYKLVRDASLAQLVTLILTLRIAYFFVRGIYRLTFHPLSKYPGPWPSAISHLPAVVSTWRGIEYKRLTDLHEKYGAFVRIAPDELSFIDPDAWKDIHGHARKGMSTGMPHKLWHRFQRTPDGSKSMIISQDEDHNRMRRIFTPAFSDRALKQQEPLFMKYVNRLAEKLHEGIEKDPKHKFDMVKMYNFTTFDVMGDLTFGESLRNLEEGKYDPWVATIFAGVKHGTRLGLLMLYPTLDRIIKALFSVSVIDKKRREHYDFSRERVEKRLAKGRKHEGVDIWDLVLEKSEEKGQGLSRSEMDNNAMLFMTAGTETTATLVSGLTSLLLEHPECMRKLTAEIRGAFATPEDMNIEQCAALPYLNACIKEALRLYPPVATGLARMAPPEGSMVCGHYIPPGWTVTAQHYAMYHSPTNFLEPESFIPDRWLGDPKFENDKRHALQPFHVGPRDCLGRNMAYHEMRLIMTRVLHTFDIQLCDESRNWRDQACYFLWEKHPLMCTLKAVK